MVHKPACDPEGDCNLYEDVANIRVALVGHPENIGDTSGLINAVKDTKAMLHFHIEQSQSAATAERQGTIKARWITGALITIIFSLLMYIIKDMKQSITDLTEELRKRGAVVQVEPDKLAAKPTNELSTVSAADEAAMKVRSYGR